MLEPFYTDELTTLYHGDCETVLADLEEPVDLVFTSPPYNLGTNPGGQFGHWKDGGKRGGMGKWQPGSSTTNVIDYDDHDDALPYPEYRNWQRRVLSALWDQLADGGAIFYNHKPRIQRAGLLLPLDLIPDHVTLRQIVIWDRGSGPNFTPTSFQSRSEWLLVLARDAWRLRDASASGVGDVWRVAAERHNPHPAPFPIGLPARAIEATRPAVVLDPFAGSGTTLRAARDAGVRAIGIERSERYCAAIVDRLAQGSLFANPA